MISSVEPPIRVLSVFQMFAYPVFPLGPTGGLISILFTSRFQCSHWLPYLHSYWASTCLIGGPVCDIIGGPICDLIGGLISVLIG